MATTPQLSARLLICGSHKTVKIIDVDSGKPVTTYNTPKPVIASSFSKNGKGTLIASADSFSFQEAFAALPATPAFALPPGSADSLFSTKILDSRYVLAGIKGQKAVLVFESKALVSGGVKPIVYEADKSPIIAIAAGPYQQNQAAFATSSENGSVNLHKISLSTDKQSHSVALFAQLPTSTPAAKRALHMTPNAVYAGSDDGSVTAWPLDNTANGITVPKVHNARVMCITTLNHNATVAVSVGEDGSIVVTNFIEKRAVLSTTIAKQLCSLSVSADDLVTAVGAKDGTLTLLETTKIGKPGAPTRTIDMGTNLPVVEVQFCPLKMAAAAQASAPSAAKAVPTAQAAPAAAPAAAAAAPTPVPTSAAAPPTAGAAAAPPAPRGSTALPSSLAGIKMPSAATASGAAAAGPGRLSASTGAPLSAAAVGADKAPAAQPLRASAGAATTAGLASSVQASSAAAAAASKAAGVEDQPALKEATNVPAAASGRGAAAGTASSLSSGQGDQDKKTVAAPQLSAASAATGTSVSGHLQRPAVTVPSSQPASEAGTPKEGDSTLTSPNTLPSPSPRLPGFPGALPLASPGGLAGAGPGSLAAGVGGGLGRVGGLQEQAFKEYIDMRVGELRNMIKTVHEETIRQAHMQESVLVKLVSELAGRQDALALQIQELRQLLDRDRARHQSLSLL